MSSSTALSSGLINATAATQVGQPGRQYLSGVTVITDNTNTATITVYDNGSGAASGTVLAKLTATVTTGANSLAFITPVRAELGLVVSVTGSGAPQGIIYYGA